MNSWKRLFGKSTLSKADNFKGKITDVEHTNSSIKAIVKTNREFNVEATIEEGVLFDVNCSCSAKSHCVHEAVFLKFMDEYPEILEDQSKIYDEKKSVLNVDCDDMLDTVSSTKLKSFIKKQFKQNPKFKYDFIKHFKDKSLIDRNLYEKKLKRIFSNAKGQGFSYCGWYDMDMLAKPLKQFMRSDIKKLIDAHEYQFACELLNRIMDTLEDEIYLTERSFDNAVYYYQDYAQILLYTDITKKQKNKLNHHLDRFGFFGY